MVRRRSIRILLILIGALILLAAVTTAVDYLLNAGHVFPGAAVAPSGEGGPPEDVPPGSGWVPFWPDPPVIPRPEAVKGIYVTGYTAGKGHFPELLHLIDRTELNSVVIDLKDDNGRLTYSRTAIPWAADAGAPHTYISDPVAFMKQLEQRGVYPIARIVTFKDSVMARHFPGQAIQHRQGGLWRDGGGDYWLDPYNKENWKYAVAVAREAAQLGFREIQFDYVRFPESGNLSAALYPAQDGTPFNDVVPAFLRYARASLTEYGVEISIDAFGMVTTDPGGMGIGQHLESLATAVDYICPMIYPSHYEPGNLGLPDPDVAPYETVYFSLAEAQRRLVQAGVSARLRPWLQSFTIRHYYGVPEIRGQINAAYDLGIDEYLLWNAANYYNSDALRPAGPEE
ncbi:MAG: putative glycoside hydrolase [Firmicutes bacterium]|nr:putative glycoside hydrolase [Bacillota bacterium]